MNLHMKVVGRSTDHDMKRVYALCYADQPGRQLKSLARLTMCKHILNAQVSIRAPCCKKFFDCPECHAEREDHNLARTMEMVFMCKKCKKAFRKDMTQYEEADEFCPHCDNQYVVEAKEPQAIIGVEGEDARKDSRMIKDDRVKTDASRSLFAKKDVSDKVDVRLRD